MRDGLLILKFQLLRIILEAYPMAFMIVKRGGESRRARIIVGLADADIRHGGGSLIWTGVDAENSDELIRGREIEELLR